MRFPLKTLGLLLASLAVTSCGGGGGDGGGATSPPANGTITLTASRTALPRNPNNVAPYPGSPYMAEVAFTYRSATGAITALTADATFTISSPSVASISPPDDPATPNINEMAARMVSFHDKTNNGSYVMFVNSYDVAGTATLTAQATDPSTGRTVTKTLDFTVAGATPLPATLNIAPSPASIYVPGAGGATSSIITVQVRDGANQPVPNPGSADNVRFEILGNAGNAILSATSAAGPASGASVTTQTVNGIATASFQAGTVQGAIQIRATVDRSDNNVSNGITDPIPASTTVVVSDGKLHSLKITSPDIDAIMQNLVTTGVSSSGDPITAPDGTYSLTVSVTASDALENPVVPGTVIQFGAVSEPVTGFPGLGGGTFQIAGNNGNPQEGGTLFTAPNAQFLPSGPGGGVGPGDTVLVFGKLVDGNHDLQNVRRVQSISAPTSLTVTSAFNRNDTTGNLIDYGSVIPYVIGRGGSGIAITAQGITNELGVATVRLTYPVSLLGKANIIWAQGNVAGSTKTVADISPMRLPGVAPAVLAVAPNPVPGNTATSVRVCLRDALGSGIGGARIGFAFSGVGGAASLDGQPNAGTIIAPTGTDGCTTGQVITAGVGESGASIAFTSGVGVASTIPIVAPTALILQATPSTITGSGGSVALRLTDGSGVGLAGVQISAVCSASAQLSGPIAPTGAGGQTTAQINILNKYGSAVSGTCVFSAAGGSATATVNAQGVDLCVTNPSNSQCSTTDDRAMLTVVLQRGIATGSRTITSSPAGLASCTLGASDGPSTTCTGSFSKGTTVALNSTGPVTWTGAGCVAAPGNLSAVVTLTGATATCTATFAP